MESRHYFQQKGADAEVVIHALAADTFFTDWCYANPKKPDGKELCDLLVVFDDTAIIWQVKDLKVDERGLYDNAEVEKNLRQLGGARRTLFDLKTPITLVNPRRGPELFNPAVISHVHLISVLMGEGEGPIPITQKIKGHRLHVFTREFADIALNELDTVADFCRYLRAKEGIDPSKQLIVLSGEENLLGKYIETGRSLAWMDDYDLICIDDTIWPKIESMSQYAEKKKLDAISYGWDSMIERAHEGSTKYELVARELARPDRYTRRLLSRSFMEAYSEFTATDRDLFRRVTQLGDTAYCFLITSDDERPSARNESLLRSMCFVARGINKETRKVLGVATSRANKGYDFLFIDKPDWTAEDEALKLRLQEAYMGYLGRRGSLELPNPNTRRSSKSRDNALFEQIGVAGFQG